jgi:hypothetical protein
MIREHSGSLREGAGVRLDVPVKAEQALDTAYVMALEKARVNATDPQIKDEIDTALTNTRKRLNAEGK